MRAGLLLTAIPGLAAQFNRVPRRYVITRKDNALVECVCGRRPIIPRGELVACERARSWVPCRSECSRHFVYAVREVLVFRAPA